MEQRYGTDPSRRYGTGVERVWSRSLFRTSYFDLHPHKETTCLHAESKRKLVTGISCTMHKHRCALPRNCDSQRSLCSTCEGYFAVDPIAKIEIAHSPRHQCFSWCKKVSKHIALTSIYQHYQPGAIWPCLRPSISVCFETCK